MLKVRQTTLVYDGIEFVRTVFDDPLSPAWPSIEIEPKDDALPVLITRIGVRTYRVESWYKSSASDAHCQAWTVRSEERALKVAATRVAKLCV